MQLQTDKDISFALHSSSAESWVKFVTRFCKWNLIFCRGKGGEQLIKVGVDRMVLVGTYPNTELHCESGIHVNHSEAEAECDGHGSAHSEQWLCGIHAGFIRVGTPQEGL